MDTPKTIDTYLAAYELAYASYINAIEAQNKCWDRVEAAREDIKKYVATLCEDDRKEED